MKTEYHKYFALESITMQLSLSRISHTRQLLLAIDIQPIHRPLATDDDVQLLRNSNKFTVCRSPNGNI